MRGDRIPQRSRDLGGHGGSRDTRVCRRPDLRRTTRPSRPLAGPVARNRPRRRGSRERKIRSQTGNARPRQRSDGSRCGDVPRPAFSCTHTPPRTFQAGQAVTVTLKVSGAASPAVTFRYRHVNQAERWQSAAMSNEGQIIARQYPRSTRSRRSRSNITSISHTMVRRDSTRDSMRSSPTSRTLS